MKIVVRTSHFMTFIPFMKTFIRYYSPYLKDLVVIADPYRKNDKNMYKVFKENSDIPTHILSKKDMMKGWPTDNDWAAVLYKTLQFQEVLSLDDDIVFIKSGMIEKIKEIQYNTGKSILGFREPGEDFLNSFFIYMKNVDVSPGDFLSLEEVERKYRGCDAALLSFKNIETIGYIDEIEPTFFDKYCTHIGSVSVIYNDITAKMIDKNYDSMFFDSIKTSKMTNRDTFNH